MNKVRAKNLASSTLLSGMAPADTTLIVAAGTGSRFPTLTGGDYFYLTLISAALAVEVVKVTARSTDTMTVVRAADGTTALTWLAADKVELRVVAGALEDAADWMSQKGQASGLATLDAGGKVPVAQIATGGANGIAVLDASAKIATALLYVGGTDGLVQLVSSKVPMSLLPTGGANGISLLDASSKVPMSALYAGVASGLATLDAGGVIPSGQLPPLNYVPLAGGTMTGALVVNNTITSNNIITGTEIRGVCAPTGASGGKLAKITYSTSPASGTPASDGEWWVQHEA